MVIYEGGWIGEKRYGKAIVKNLKSGITVTGTFKNNRQHGKFTIIDKNNNIFGGSNFNSSFGLPCTIK